MTQPFGSELVCMVVIIRSRYCVLSLMPLLQCRPINNILGFSRETLVAVITNIEGREWCW